jgi:predicted ester cyclase
MFFFRVENQRIVEVWELLDQDEFRRQLTGS